MDNPVGNQEQTVYLNALKEGAVADVIELGNYVARVKCAPLATRDKRGRPIIVKSDWPVKVRDRSGKDCPGADYMVSYAHRVKKKRLM